MDYSKPLLDDDWEPTQTVGPVPEVDDAPVDLDFEMEMPPPPPPLCRQTGDYATDIGEPLQPSARKKRAKKPRQPRKRKKADDDQTAATRKRLKATAQTPDELIDIENMTKRSLDERSAHKEIEVNTRSQEELVAVITKCYSMVIDKASKGNGNVSKAMQDNPDLHAAIGDELSQYIHLFSAKLRIGLYTLASVIQGKILSAATSGDSDSPDDTHTETVPDTDSSLSYNKAPGMRV